MFDCNTNQQQWLMPTSNDNVLVAPYNDYAPNQQHISDNFLLNRKQLSADIAHSAKRTNMPKENQVTVLTPMSGKAVSANSNNVMLRTSRDNESRLTWDTSLLESTSNTGSSTIAQQYTGPSVGSQHMTYSQTNAVSVPPVRNVKIESTQQSSCQPYASTGQFSQVFVYINNYSFLKYRII